MSKTVSFVPYGNVRDYASFYAAIVPARKSTAQGGPKLHLPLADTALLARGKVVRWLQTAPNGEATEKLQTEKHVVRDAFKTAGECAGAVSRRRSASTRVH